MRFFGNIRNNYYRNVVGIQPTSSIIYYNERFYKRDSRKNRRKQKQFSKNTKKQIENNTNKQSKKTYKSSDLNIIYFREYCKVRNSKRYNQLNPNNGIINFEDRYKKYTNSHNNVNTKKPVDLYNKTKSNDFKITKFREPKRMYTERKTPTKQQEMRNFKENLKKIEKTELDKAVEEFEIALRRKRRYDAQMKGQFKVIKGKNYKGMDR